MVPRHASDRVRREVVGRWLLAAAIVCAPGLAAASEEAADLDRVLGRLARVADRYTDEALRFTCDESISFTAGHLLSRFRFQYIYRVTEDGMLWDHRVPIGGTKKKLGWKEGDPISFDDAGLPVVLLRPYSWVFVFDRRNRERYRFALEGEDRVLGADVLRVRFEAVPPYERNVNEWLGTAYVDRETFQLVRVEAYHVEDSVARIRHYRTDFNAVEHGMHFPGQVRIENRTPQYVVSQTYKKYKFFSVRTVEEMRDDLLDESDEP